MRALATVQRVKAVTAIPDSDFLEAAQILGWQCVVKKGEFHEGELGVYFEVDSFLPVEERYEFLRASSYRENANNGIGFRIRTIKLRGEISQGLFLPIAVFPELADAKEGDDVTEKLRVKKWYVPEVAGKGGASLGGRPYGIPTSDEIRIQSAPELLHALHGKPYYITTKMDGTSNIVYFLEGKIGCCSRNLEIKDEQDAIYWAAVYKYNLKEKLSALGRNIILTGELCGPGIQKNRLRLEGLDWFVFDVMDGDTRKYYPYDEAVKTVEGLGLKFVPLEERGESFNYTQAELLEKARGKYPSGLDKEGIVVRWTEQPKTISFKVLNNDALLKEKG
jgi:RNA ligase (TIGR02306 family)